MVSIVLNKPYVEHNHYSPVSFVDIGMLKKNLKELHMTDIGKIITRVNAHDNRQMMLLKQFFIVKYEVIHLSVNINF